MANSVHSYDRLQPQQQQVYIPPREVVWLPPPQGYLKLNFDGGLLRDKSSAIGAGLFRDHTGAVVISYGIACPSISGSTPYDGEATALFRGLYTAYINGVNKLWVEGDAKFLIEVVERKRENIRCDRDGKGDKPWYNEKVIDDIRLLLDKFPERPKLTFIHREGNTAADALVKFLHDNPTIIWDRCDSLLPDSVAQITRRECRGYTYIRKSSTFVRERQQHCRLIQSSTFQQNHLQSTVLLH